MIQPDEKLKLDALRTQVHCPRRFRCVESSLDDLCKAAYHADLGILECLEPIPGSCGCAKPFASAFVCRCPLRMYIAQNFDRWSAESTAILRQMKGCAGAGRDDRGTR